MAQTPRRYTKGQLRGAIYGHWNPDEYSTIWLENGVYAQLQRDLAYYRAHPQNANPDELLKLLKKLIKSWDRERDKVQDVIQEMVLHYNDVIDQLNEDDKEILRLRKTIQRIQESLSIAIEKQNDLTKQIKEINDRDEKSEELALKYRNKLVQLFNEIADNVYYIKFSEEYLLTVQQKISDIDNLQLAPATIQAIAVEGISKIQSAHRLVNRKKTEFELAYIIAEEQMENLKEQFLKWHEDTYFDQERKNKIDMDYWSRGQFSDLYTKFNCICKKIENSSLRIGYMIENLNDDIEKLGLIREKGMQIVEEVLNVSNMSEQLESMGNLSALILAEDFGYTLKRIGFNNDDVRDTYVVQMENEITGSKIQFSFVPLSQTQSMCNYRISFAKFIDEYQAKRVLDSILHMLKDNGISFITNETNITANIVDDIILVPSEQTIHLRENYQIQI